MTIQRQSSEICLPGSGILPCQERFHGNVSLQLKTPSKGIIFVMCVCSIAPFFGREVLNWVVDMAAVGTGVGYFFTCAGAGSGILPCQERFHGNVSLQLHRTRYPSQSKRPAHPNKVSSGKQAYRGLPAKRCFLHL